MKKYLIFIIACLLVCLLPFVGMAVRPTTVSTENKAMAEFPSLKADDGKLNLKYFEELEEYFNEHFAFRNELVYADAKLQTSIFQVSNVDTVTYGTDGWLYYSSTLDDYLGNQVMSGRQIYNLAHNLSIAKRYVEEKGCDFMLAIPPNKNTLYGEHMPYYNSYIVDETHNIDLLTPKLEKLHVPYADLLQMFRNEKETLYLRRDSHWNNKGAVMAYNCMMDTLGYQHENYADCDVTRTKDTDGDLNKMLYTFYGEKELNYNYHIEHGFTYSEKFESVEDGWIETKGGTGNGSLLMFRDSFGNTLIPFIADQFEQAWFTKENPYGLESLMEQYMPDTVMFECVERNIVRFINMPPIISAIKTETPVIGERMETDTKIDISPLEYDSNYYKISGNVDEKLLENETDIIVRLNDTCYEAYHTGENTYELYIKKDTIVSQPLELEVLLRDSENCRSVQIKNIDEGERLQ
ncbi:MAG: hypothetical protein NC311_15970 [Muribaculaceae bacterium]|nr:hypothetical protein [Muribaculaceae bacterium]MCM1398867.1 hypothetical protein [Clostridium sp.]MCM1458502.1 hypothetical protein [Bacteroides sp.]